MSKTKTSENAKPNQESDSSGSSVCSDAFWPRGWGEHEVDTITRRLKWQTGNIDGPSDFKFAEESKLTLTKQYIEPGSKVVVEWEDYSDEGYIFTLPGIEGNDCRMAGIVHIPHPKNNGGKDSLAPVWLTLDELLRLCSLKRVVI